MESSSLTSRPRPSRRAMHLGGAKHHPARRNRFPIRRDPIYGLVDEFAAIRALVLPRGWPLLLLGRLAGFGATAIAGGGRGRFGRRRGHSRVWRHEPLRSGKRSEE